MAMVSGQTKQKIMTAIQIVAVVVIFLIFCLIILSISFRIMEYHTAVIQSLNLTGKVVLNGTAVPKVFYFI
jgi:preprotein translocase subunit YajC